MRVRRWIVLALGAAALAATAHANLRLARKVDGVFSGNLKFTAAARVLRLVTEHLEAVFPDLDLAALGPQDAVRFKVVYEIDNPANAPATVPLRFLAVDIRDLRAELNGRVLAVQMRNVPEEKTECLASMAKHRAGFLPAFYGEFLRRLRSSAGFEGESGDDWIHKLAEKDLRSLPASESFHRTLESPPETDFPAAEFEISLPPGANRLIVTYGQRLFIDERNHGYFAAWPRRGVTGFDYLLYPAKTWEWDAGFRLRVSVRVPDGRGKFLFFKPWKRPEIKCNLPLKEGISDEKHVRVFQGEFRGMPADILTFLLWFDRKAADYVR